MNLKTLTTAVAAATLATAAHSAPPPKGIKNVVLVHGAFADGSGWAGVASILKKDGYTVTVVQQPETSFAEDVKATERVLSLQDGPTVLVGHSYGGSIITQAGNHANVASLVYVDAYQPDQGETTGILNDKEKSPGQSAIKATPDGFLYIDPARFHADFAAEMPADKAEFMARSQVMTALVAFGDPIVAAAWRTKPSFTYISTDDRIIPPDLKRWMAKRANSQVVEAKGSHASFVTNFKGVAKLIERAATGEVQPQAQASK